MKSLIASALWIIITTATPGQASAQADEIAQLALNYQKLAQLKSILKNMYQGYEILTKGYNTVKGLSEGNFKVHDVFLSGLMQVSPAVRNYKRISEIIEAQALLIKEYKKAAQRFESGNLFRKEELSYFDSVYDLLLKESLKNMDALTMVLTANKLRMSDDERLKSIDRIHADTNDKLSFLRSFNSEINMLSLQRLREANDIKTLQGIHGLQNK